MTSTSTDTGGLSRQIARKLRSRIADEAWAIGGRLPPVRELAEDFSVSTETVRGAMRELETLGLVETRPRQGAFVRSFTAEAEPPATGAAQSLIGFVRTTSEEVLDPAGVTGADEWGVRMTLGVDQRLGDADFSLTLVSAAPGTADVSGVLLEKLVRLGPALAGVVVVFHEPLRPLVEELRRRGLPCVTIGSESCGYGDNFIAAANVAGGRVVGQCFARLGHRRVMYVSTDLRQRHSALDKFTGLVQGYVLAGVAPPTLEHVEADDWSAAAGEASVGRSLQAGFVPEAIFTEGDFLAEGALRACKRAGLRVPRDVDVVGSTEVAGSRFFDPPLTTVQQPAPQLGAAAGEMILRLVAGEVERAAGEVVPTRLLLRGSMRLPAAVRAAMTPDPLCPLVEA